jgi:hypothetical protein
MKPLLNLVSGLPGEPFLKYLLRQLAYFRAAVAAPVSEPFYFRFAQIAEHHTVQFVYRHILRLLRRGFRRAGFTDMGGVAAARKFFVSFIFSAYPAVMPFVPGRSFL